MTPERRSVLLTSAIALPLIALVLLAGPLVVPPSPSPGASHVAVATPTVQRSGSAFPSPGLTPAPTGDPISSTVDVHAERIRGPFGHRIRPTAVWTGTEVIVWGGWIGRRLGVGPPQADGAAYDPAGNRWRSIAEPPIPGSADHLATWTGREMLVWGGWAHPRPRPKPEGAAYYPETDTWRRMAIPPIRWGSYPADVWTGEEWVIAMNRPDVIVVAAYDPDRDSWRRLPDIRGDLGDDVRLLWTGSELLLVAGTAGLHRLSPDGGSWIRTEAHVGSAAIVIDGRVLDVQSELGLVEWRAESDTVVTIARPPRPTYGLSPITDHRVVLGPWDDGPALMFDLDSATWAKVDLPRREKREDAVELWFGDRLFAWGGWVGGPDRGYRDGVLYTPDW